jgi:hypothetical protein
MILGMTGTQQGLSAAQRKVAAEILNGVLGTAPSLHHGDCIGADVQLADMAHPMGFFVVAHPPTDPKKRAYHDSDLIMPERPYLERNRNIVKTCELMLAFPKEYVEQWRGSGTWATIRYSRKIKRHLWIIWPKGESTVIDENSNVMNFGNVSFA